MATITPFSADPPGPWPGATDAYEPALRTSAIFIRPNVRPEF